MAYKLTVRHGPKVSREKHESLSGVLSALRERVGEIRREGNLDSVSMIRTYEPKDQVNARLEVSTGGLLRSRDAGIDVMGDGELVAFSGGVFRKPIEPPPGEGVFEAVERALTETG
jgi:hypothetical protein